jgi:branched-chain amino acid transport system substrate-binding protein
VRQRALIVLKETTMNLTPKTLGTIAITALIHSGAHAETIRIGVIAPLSGPYAQAGASWKAAFAVYQKLNGDSVDGNKVELVWRDHPTPDPARAKALAQELVIKEKVQYLTGLQFTPDAIGAAQVSEASKTPTVCLTCSGNLLLEKSRYLIRTSFTVSQIAVPTARYLLDKGIKTAAVVTADFSSGIDAETAFAKAFTEGGGKIVKAVRFPLSTTDYGPIVQTVLAAEPGALFNFVPGVGPGGVFAKSFIENGGKKKNIKFIGLGGMDEHEMDRIGPDSVGLESTFPYATSHKSALNDKVRKALKDLFPGTDATIDTAPAYDGMHLIYKMIAVTGGKPDADKAIASLKGYKWESPRGMVSIDSTSRELQQPVYVRAIDRDKDGKSFNREFQAYENQPTYSNYVAAPAKP